MSLRQLSHRSIPKDSVLGLNYSGMHDTALALVSPDGTPLYAAALERFSRLKQDGRPPYALLNELPWDRIAKVAIPTNGEFVKPTEFVSQLHPIRLAKPHSINVLHDPVFYEFVKRIPCEVEFVCHRISHVASSFWGSEFEDALCLNYDGGMANDPWFGGLYRANRKEGIVPLDQFSAEHYAKITLLYQVVTALLGFTASKHEGKVTGLAAYGKPSERCRAVFYKWLKEGFLELESTLRWIFPYRDEISARIVPNGTRLQEFCKEALAYPREEIAATIQDMAESHILEILAKARELGWTSDNICLSGGLFANVKINQRVSEAGFKKLFVAPPMTDDGTALGAAWHVLSKQHSFKPTPLRSMYLGPSYPPEITKAVVEGKGIYFEAPANPAASIAALLAEGAVVAVFQGAMEFGPRSLGNRSILASAADPDINHLLNERLNRTEFMPFAPIGRMEDADACYLNIDRVRHAAEFMTVTVNCTDSLKSLCPAVVHVDGTARPQLVTAECNPLVHATLTEYQKLTGLPVLVNTSFNIHEEPIVCSPEDALRGFFESALDYLYMEGVGIISFKGNENVAFQYMQKKLRFPSQKTLELKEMNELLENELSAANKGLEEKEAVIQELSAALNAFRQAAQQSSTH
ncbi:MAG: hypothetical protein M0R47_17605 [Methylobacter sp.]|uniref:carbamoyltransferase C-terminal domain-containing protein n=1 Tax=Methylobacter sp. TaxID=2051955 RepID=UPI0025F312FF|nr:carbamoyltransferase C-terminal domain-containing protein [Methylobacter sp.]MCK9622340.1 hypothetical protein [Methylobacter sp.]